MPRIAFLSYYSGIHDRGVESHIHELANRLTKLGHQVTVYQHGPQLPHSQYRTLLLSSPSVLPPNIDAQILFPANGRLQNIAARLWAIKSGAKVVVVGHSGPGFDDRLNLLTFPHVFVSLTHSQKKWAHHANPLVRLHVIPNGVDTEVFRPQATPMKVNLPKPVILCVAALTSSKRQELLLRAAHRLGISVLLAGRGERETALTGLGETLLKDRFKLLPLPPTKMPSLYKAADLFSYPCVSWESFGIVLLEAMASNLGIVATDDPIRREIVGDAGLFVDPTQIDKYAQTLWQALKTDWQYLPRTRAEQFSWDAIALKYHRLCQELIS